MTNPVPTAIRFGQTVSWWDSPWRCGAIELQDGVVRTQVIGNAHAAATTCMLDLDILHWENVAVPIRNIWRRRSATIG